MAQSVVVLVFSGEMGTCGGGSIATPVPERLLSLTAQAPLQQPSGEGRRVGARR